MEAPLSGVLRGLADGVTLHSAMAESLRAGQRHRLATGRRDKNVLIGAKHMEQLSVLCVEGKVENFPQHVYLCECTAADTFCMAWQ